MLADERKPLRIGRVYWYTWLSHEGITDSAFDFSGLRRLRGGQLVSAPSLTVFTRLARRLQGCAKQLGRRTPLPLTPNTLQASCGGETATGLSWRNDRSGGCSRPRSPGASAS